MPDDGIRPWSKSWPRRPKSTHSHPPMYILPKRPPQGTCALMRRSPVRARRHSMSHLVRAFRRAEWSRVRRGRWWRDRAAGKGKTRTPLAKTRRCAVAFMVTKGGKPQNLAASPHAPKKPIDLTIPFAAALDVNLNISQQVNCRRRRQSCGVINGCGHGAVLLKRAHLAGLKFAFKRGPSESTASIAQKRATYFPWRRADLPQGRRTARVHPDRPRIGNSGRSSNNPSAVAFTQDLSPPVPPLREKNNLKIRAL